jgi:hypothetical protein
MLHSFHIAVVLSLAAVMMVPILIEFEHHDDGPVSHETTCPGDCGCICHLCPFAVMESQWIQITVLVGFMTDSFKSTSPTAEPTAIDHPPELTS